MRIIWTETALADLDSVLAYTSIHYPTLVAAVELRIRAVVSRAGRWPESDRPVEERPGVRVVPLLRYPYRMFYRVADDHVEILHLHHAARGD
jgi:plasmid stabilization system protein ParE